MKPLKTSSVQLRLPSVLIFFSFFLTGARKTTGKRIEMVSPFVLLLARCGFRWDERRRCQRWRAQGQEVHNMQSGLHHWEPAAEASTRAWGQRQGKCSRGGGGGQPWKESEQVAILKNLLFIQKKSLDWACPALCHLHILYSYVFLYSDLCFLISFLMTFMLLLTKKVFKIFKR